MHRLHNVTFYALKTIVAIETNGGNETYVLVAAYATPADIPDDVFETGDDFPFLWDRIEKLERLVGKLTLENEFLKKGLQHRLSQSQRNGKSSPASNTSSGISAGVA